MEIGEADYARFTHVLFCMLKFAIPLSLSLSLALKETSVLLLTP